MFREAVSVICIGLGILVLIVASADYIMERMGSDLIEDDGPIESYIEDVIEDHLHFKVDLTPDSPEATRT